MAKKKAKPSGGQAVSLDSEALRRVPKVYANYVSVSSTPEEMALTFSVKQSMLEPPGTREAAKEVLIPQVTVFLHLAHAARLANVMNNQLEKAKAEIETLAKQAKKPDRRRRGSKKA